MATEHEKTKAYERGLNDESAKSAASLIAPDEEEIQANEEGQREAARLDKQAEADRKDDE